MNPADKAHEVITAVMDVGSSKDGKNESWRDKHQDYHLDRAIRHAMTHKLIRDGHQPKDGDNHLDLAMTRLAMALCTDKRTA